MPRIWYIENTRTHTESLLWERRAEEKVVIKIISVAQLWRARFWEEHCGPFCLSTTGNMLSFWLEALKQNNNLSNLMHE